MCKDFLHANVSAIVYLMNYEQYGRSTASAQYFLQLAGYLGIPVISWNADNSGLGISETNYFSMKFVYTFFFQTRTYCISINNASTASTKH